MDERQLAQLARLREAQRDVQRGELAAVTQRAASEAVRVAQRRRELAQARALLVAAGSAPSAGPRQALLYERYMQRLKQQLAALTRDLRASELRLREAERAREQVRSALLSVEVERRGVTSLERSLRARAERKLATRQEDEANDAFLARRPH